ncbi:hypothetical protein F511_30076 [Dorcoceras hygrometricum]|uniref:Splicing factor 3B subunit 1-like n=1 Tax=Dorcoceras hygrometricum TaxID=472368 RepID=A0A2Z7B3Y1_9LAMI|nr:hypothetical protein F511_30076 [Dorcoceras hygrometricum]
MASALINNTIQVYFASVLGMEHEGMVSMFEALLAFGLSGFLGCSSAIYEAALVEFFQNASVRDGMLPLEGLTDLHEVPQDLVSEARRAFSYDDKLLSTYCKKREMEFEFRLLNDILAKSMIVKAGSFNVVTHERFLMMSDIYGGVPINWGRLLFNIFKDMVTPAMRQARGYAMQICALLKNAPDLELGESKEFPTLKILTAKTVGTYIAKNRNIYVDEDEPVVEKPVEKKKAVSKKRHASTVGTPAVKRKRTTGKATPAATSLALVPVAQEAIPIQMISAVTPSAGKRKTPKRRLTLPAGSDDEIVDKEPTVESVVEQRREKTTADEVDKIIYHIISETAQMETDME